MATISTQHLSWRSPQQSNYQLLDAGVQQEKMHAVENKKTIDIFAVESLAPYRLDMLNWHFRLLGCSREKKQSEIGSSRQKGNLPNTVEQLSCNAFTECGFSNAKLSFPSKPVSSGTWKWSSKGTPCRVLCRFHGPSWSHNFRYPLRYPRNIELQQIIKSSKKSHKTCQNMSKQNTQLPHQSPVSFPTSSNPLGRLKTPDPASRDYLDPWERSVALAPPSPETMGWDDMGTL